jgi:hypothetical protein
LGGVLIDFGEGGKTPGFLKATGLVGFEFVDQGAVVVNLRVALGAEVGEPGGDGGFGVRVGDVAAGLGEEIGEGEEVVGNKE